MLLEHWDKQKQADELAKLERDFGILVREAEGHFFTDNGYHPEDLHQARARFAEATMWLRRWMEWTT